jgi:hypothetical protein
VLAAAGVGAVRAGATLLWRTGYAPSADNPTAGQEHCEQLRQALQETEQRRQFGGPPWEIQRLENRYHQIRERLQVECGI